MQTVSSSVSQVHVVLFFSEALRWGEDVYLSGLSSRHRRLLSVYGVESNLSI